MSNLEAVTPTRGRPRVPALIASVAVLGLMVLAYVAPHTGFGPPNVEGLDPIDDLWVGTAAALVFLMQAGFLCFEVGLARANHMAAVAMKNLVDWSIVSVLFTMIGFAVMFGDSIGGFLGTDLFGLVGINQGIESTVSAPIFFIFQLAFAGTAATIVSGSLVERTTFLAYVAVTCVITLVIYPVYGHWVWAGLAGGEEGWLALMGFHDFAGGTVVHLVGGTVALVGVWIVGPRIGRFDSEGNAQTFPPSNIGITALGVLILWVGWWGFNGGSVLGFNGDVGRVILMTNLAGAAGLVSAGVHAYAFQNRAGMNVKLIGGALTGLVAVTPGADVLGVVGAIAVGVGAGVIHNVTMRRLELARIDDALGAVPVHAAGGAWGTLALALFSPAAAFDVSRPEQLVIQTVGVLVCIAWSGGVAFAAFRVLGSVFGLRVAPERELGGLQSWEATEASRTISEDELEELFG